MLICYNPQKSPCTGVYSACTAQDLKVVPSIGFLKKQPCTGISGGFSDSIRIRNIPLEIKENLDTGKSVG